jgi:threonine/homoserine/homoserine lactone efflux protein
MQDADNLVLFLAATLTLNVTPGPDMLYVVARSVGQGRAAGVVSAVGIAAGCLVHTLAVAFGLAGLLLAVPVAYDVVRYAGAAYLIYLGLRTLARRPAPDARAEVEPDAPGAIFLQGVVTNVLNPKVALFFLAFLPQFVDPAGAGVAVQLLFLGLLFNASGTLVNLAVALGASFTGARFRTRVANAAVFRWLTSGIFLGLGVRLALLGRR